MPKKRKSGGRSKGKKGRGSRVSCSICGKVVPRDKAKRVSSYSSFVDPMIGRELRKAGTHIPRRKTMRTLCVNCAIHRGVVSIRSKSDRKKR